MWGKSCDTAFLEWVGQSGAWEAAGCQGAVSSCWARARQGADRRSALPVLLHFLHSAAPCPLSPNILYQPSLSAVLSLKVLPGRVPDIMTLAHICPKVRGVDALKAFSLNLVKPYIAPAPRQVGYSAGLAFSCQLRLSRSCC